MPGIEQYKISPDTEVQRLPDGRVEVTLSDADRDDVRLVDEEAYEPVGEQFEKSETESDERRSTVVRSGLKGKGAMSERERRKATLNKTNGWTRNDQSFGRSYRPQNEHQKDTRQANEAVRRQKRAM